MRNLIVFITAVGYFLKLMMVRIIYGKKAFQLLYIQMMQGAIDAKQSQ